MLPGDADLVALEFYLPGQMQFAYHTPYVDCEQYLL